MKFFHLGAASALTLALGACASAPEGSAGYGEQKVYIIETSGGGWSAPVKARAALSGLDAVDDVFVSGNRAVFTLDQGAATDKAPIAAALEAKGMKLESFSSEVRPKVAAAYVMKVEGITWSDKADQVRATLMKMDGIIDAYVGNTTVIHMSSKDKIAASEVQSLLDKEQVKISDMKRDDSMVL